MTTDPAGGVPPMDEDAEPSSEEQLEAELPKLAKQTEKAAAQQKEPVARQLLLLMPRLVKFLWRVARDPDVPGGFKARCVFAMTYVFSPIDVIPDFIPVIGLLDDLYVVLAVFDRLLNHLPPEVFDRCWEGDREVIDQLRGGIRTIEAILPAKSRKLLDSFFGSSAKD